MTLQAAARAAAASPPAVREHAAGWLAAHALACPERCGAFVAGMLAAQEGPQELRQRLARGIRTYQAADAAAAFLSGALAVLEPGSEPPGLEPLPLPAPAPVQRGPELPDAAAAAAWLEERVGARHEADPGAPAPDARRAGYVAAMAPVYSLEHEPGAVWLFFRKRPDAAVRQRVKAAGFRGRYSGTYTDRRGRVRKNFAGWRWAPVAPVAAARAA